MLSGSTVARAVVPLVSAAGSTAPAVVSIFVLGFRKGPCRGAVVGTTVGRGSAAYISGSTAPTSAPTAAQLSALLCFPATIGSGSTTY